MFWDKKKDAEIERLKKRIEELENQKNDEDLLLNELNEVVQKFEKGFYGITIENESSNRKLNEIKDNFNKALANNSRLAEAGIKTLIEYGNAKFDYALETDNLSGKMGSILLGIRALGNTKSTSLICSSLLLMNLALSDICNKFLDKSDIPEVKSSIILTCSELV